MKDYPVTPTQKDTADRHAFRRRSWEPTKYDLWRIVGAEAKRERRHIAAD